MNHQYYLFSWDDVPGEDDTKLISHLRKSLKIDWVESAEIKKSDDGRKLLVTDGKNSLSLVLDEEENRVLLKSGNVLFEYGFEEEDGKLSVYTKDLLLILREIDFDDDEELRSFAATIKERAMEDPSLVVKISHSEDEDDADKARSLLLNMGDVAFTPLLSGLSPDVPENYVWDTKTLMDLQLENRVKLAKVLENMLEDKRSLEMPEPPPGTEEDFLPRRVCDEAYLLMRQLLSLEEGEEEQFFNANAFLNLSDEEKDVEIKRVQTSKKWIPLTEQFY